MLARALPRSLILIAFLAPTASAEFTVAGNWVTTTSSAPRYTETWGLAEGSGGVLSAVLDAADNNDGSALVERLFEILEGTLDPVLDGTPIGPGDIPEVLKGKFRNKIVDRLDEALEGMSPKVFVGDYRYLDSFYPNIAIDGDVILVQIGPHFIGIYREKEEHGNINDAGDTLAKRAYGLIDIKVSLGNALFKVTGIPVATTGFKWSDLCIKAGLTPSKQKVKKGKKKRKGWTIETPHGLEEPLYAG